MSRHLTAITQGMAAAASRSSMGFTLGTGVGALAYLNADGLGDFFNAMLGNTPFNNTLTAGDHKFPSEDVKYYTEIFISDYRRQSLMEVGQLDIIGRVVLPLPMQLIDPHDVDYQEQEVGTATGSAIGGAQGIAGALGNPMESLQDVQTAIGSMTPGGTGSAVNQSATLAASQLGGPLAGVGRAMQAMNGYSPNQFMVVLLKGPKYKQYEFTWKLAPKDATESRKLMQIVNLFNKAMSPDLALSGALFTFPKIFQLAFRPNYEYLYRFKPAVLENFTVNYAPGGMPMFYGETGAPESIEFKMRFMEIEYWLERDYPSYGDINNNNINNDAFGGRGSSGTVTPTGGQ